MQRQHDLTSFSLYNGVAEGIALFDETAETFGIPQYDADAAKREFIVQLVYHGCYGEDMDWERIDRRFRSTAQAVFSGAGYSIAKTRKASDALLEAPLAEAESFRFYDGIMRAIELLGEAEGLYGMPPEMIEDAKNDLIVDVVNYGNWNVEPDFSRYPYEIRLAVEMAFGMMRYSLTASRAPIAAGKRGGRPRKQKEEGSVQVPETSRDYREDLGWESVSIARELA